MRNEIAMQIKESKVLLDSKVSENRELVSHIRKLKIEVGSLENQHRDYATDIASDKQRKIQENYKKIGYLERTVEDLEKNRAVIEQIIEIAGERDRLNHEKLELSEFIEQEEAHQERRRSEVAYAVSHAVVNILKGDLDRQARFAAADKVEFDFGANTVTVDGETTFSESSTVFLKNAFLLGLLEVSAKDDRLRFPRFLLLDGIENGGMERERSHNLQKLILALSDGLEVNHQIIVTTAEVAPEIEGSAAPVGDFYTPKRKALNLT
jgi:hypothetical protein